MFLSQSIPQVQNQRQRQRQRMTTDQRQAIDIQQLQYRRDLVEALNGESYRPKAECPSCFHKLSDYEIMRGFKDDPEDFTTCCPKCKHRFLPRLYRATNTTTTDMAFYCPSQTLAQLPSHAETPVEEFRTTYSALYYSAVTHFGGLKQAFARIGTTYAHEADLDWRKVVLPFLGKLPDTVIAELAGTKTNRVRRMRNKRNIRAFSRRSALGHST